MQTPALYQTGVQEGCTGGGMQLPLWRMDAAVTSVVKSKGKIRCLNGANHNGGIGHATLVSPIQMATSVHLSQGVPAKIDNSWKQVFSSFAHMTQM